MNTGAPTAVPALAVPIRGPNLREEAYQAFKHQKRCRHGDEGILVSEVSDALFPFQKPPTKWLLKKGRACCFAGTGLGKTAIEGEIARQLQSERVLIVAPLGVTGQTVAMLDRLLGLSVKRIATRHDVGRSGVHIVNYDRLNHVEGIDVGAVILDESSILKSFDGATRKYIQERFRKTPYRYPFTATPAPNDYMELGTHAEFVGAMTRQEMLATFFTHDGGDTSQWRLKRHAVSDFWKWVATWASVFNMPSDLGFPDDGYSLPELIFHEHTVDVESDIAGGLFSDGRVSATKNFSVLRDSAAQRVEVVGDLVASEPSEKWLVWCNTDDEQKRLMRVVEAVSVTGSDSAETKEDRLLGFASGRYRNLVTKPRIAGFGMNFQSCSRMVFCGVTYSFEQMYQSIRRCWRFGQTRPVHVHLVTCNAQESIKAALRVKEEAFLSMANEMRTHVRQEIEIAS